MRINLLIKYVKCNVACTRCCMYTVKVTLPGREHNIVGSFLVWPEYSRNSLNVHYRKPTALLMATLTKSRSLKLPYKLCIDRLIPVSEQLQLRTFFSANRSLNCAVNTKSNGNSNKWTTSKKLCYESPKEILTLKLIAWKQVHEIKACWKRFPHFWVSYRLFQQCLYTGCWVVNIFDNSL